MLDSQYKHSFLRPCIRIVATLYCLIPAIAFAVDVKLGWDPSYSPSAVGYNVYVSTNSENFADPIDAGNQTELLISGLEANIT